MFVCVFLSFFSFLSFSGASSDRDLAPTKQTQMHQGQEKEDLEVIAEEEQALRSLWAEFVPDCNLSHRG